MALWRPSCTEKERLSCGDTDFQEKKFVNAVLLHCKECTVTVSIQCLENRNLVFVVGLKQERNKRRKLKWS